ncbi:chemotaxis protein CheA [Desemzia sp. RIT804]|uniref:chemotaxis protein CheA n=1 Tax=Desemzia sp. RIT 804 TaxID=2810209 RepID=UPI00194F9AC1|nr:chemotaxis protein CheA [Desemzia sp. RIT 804]MBM6614720.1 chemotaxis protein CheA [Desemzia sp. RIT 804]
MEDNSKYLDLFFEESDAHIQSLNDCVLDLENDPDNQDIINEMFRSAHTLKGMAGTMGYDSLAKLTHKMENVFDLLKKETIKADSHSIGLIFDCLDSISAIVEDLREGGEGDLNVTELVGRLETVSEGSSATPVIELFSSESDDDFNSQLHFIDESDVAVIDSAAADGYQAYVVTVKIEETSGMKNARVFLVMSKLDQQGEVLYSEPDPETLEKEDFGSIFKVVLLTQADAETIKEAALNNSEIEDVLVKPFEKSDVISNEIQVQEERVEVETVEEVKETKKETKKKSKAKAAHANQTVRVDITKLDDFLNAVSELLIYRTRLESISQDKNIKEMDEPLEQFARITTELQDLVLKIRLQPVSTVMTNFPRMVRDLGNDLGKKFNLVIEGGETELDRTVVSELGEPLIHLIRNAADHGVEMPDRRQELGKDPAGLIQIAAYQEGNRVVLTVRDDGKGLDPQAIKESAERKGIVTAGLTDIELQHLIFHPGFSTAKTVTGISGRGVGMDVVQQKIHSLGGSIEIISAVNQGTTFKINLPLTLSIIDSLLIKVGESTFAIPQGIIEKVVSPGPGEIIQTYQQEIYTKGGATPLIRLTNVLDIKEIGTAEPYLIIVKLGENRFALMIDDIIKQQEIVIKDLGKELSSVSSYSGATILGNGEIVLILDITAITNESQGVQHAVRV